MPQAVCPDAITMIVGFEVTSRAAYEKLYAHPTWPGGASGITIGIGFDLGYESQRTLDVEFASIAPGVRSRLGAACGLTGEEARAMLPQFRDIAIPWTVALTAFSTHTLARYTNMTLQTFPNADKLPSDCLGALVSLVYNRGPRMRSNDPKVDERREMRDVRDAIAHENLGAVPALIRSMKRLWVGKRMDGLIERREAEARLWETGMQ